MGLYGTIVQFRRREKLEGASQREREKLRTKGKKGRGSLSLAATFLEIARYNALSQRDEGERMREENLDEM